MRPDAGTVALDDATDRRARNALRRRVALIECSRRQRAGAEHRRRRESCRGRAHFSGLASDPLSARRWLDDHNLRSFARLPIADLAPSHRLRILLELASARPGVDGLVLVSPDRQGCDPAQWWELAEEFAERGFAVLVIAGEAAAPPSPTPRHPSAASLQGPRPQAQPCAPGTTAPLAGGHRLRSLP
ncbi:hypothetical protein GCM10023065_31390 [Microbacterium laevaniformans]|uniref:hypothetical protein n=1 Tax=Microbacterium laevaniformans TaxID=36807 RepID=UPI0031E6B252